MERGSVESRDRFQVRLWDLIVVVVGASYVLDVARRSKVAWGGGLPDLAHAVGLTVLTFGVAVGLVVVSHWVRRLREPGKGRAWASIWRVLAVGWLAGSVVEVAAALQVVTTTAPTRGFGDHAELRLRLTTLMATLGMVGLMLASAPLRPRSMSAPRKPRPRLGSWPSVTLAALVGIVIVTLGHGLIPYLVLIAMEAVANAMRGAPLAHRPIVFDRLTTAALGALPGLIGCLLTAVWVDDDLRNAVRDPIDARAPRSWWGMIARFATVILAASGSAYALLVSYPTLNPWLVEGMEREIDPSTIATVALGYAALSAGIAARSAAHLAAGTESIDQPASRESPFRWFGPWPRRIFGVIMGVVCLEITASAVQVIRRDLEYRWYIPVGLGTWGSIFEVPASWLGSLNTGIPTGYRLIDSPDKCLIGIAGVWLTSRLVGLIVSKSSDRASPLDAIASDPLALGRFLGWWIGLTTLMLASLPGLAILGVTLIHFVVFWVAT